jgi:hypothetical protein
MFHQVPSPKTLSVINFFVLDPNFKPLEAITLPSESTHLGVEGRGTIEVIELRPGRKGLKEEVKETTHDLDVAKLETELSNNQEVLNQVLNIMKGPGVGDVGSKLVGDNESKVDKQTMSKEDEPTFHQDYAGPTTENTSKEPVMVEADWNSEKMSYQIDDEQTTVLSNADHDRSESTTLPEFVKQLVMSPPRKPKFDPQQLLEKIRLESKYNLNHVWNSQYELLTCKAQPFLIRLTMTGEFIDHL